MSGHLCNLHIRDLRRCPIQLRPVRKETLDYYMLRDSIRDVGILMPLLVRPIEEWYEVVAGNNRFECATDLRMEEVPCVVRNISDREVLRIQVMENSNRIQTNPVDYVRRLQKIIHSGDMSVEELAFAIHRHPDWVRNLLSLNCLSEEWKDRLANREVSITAGVELAKLPIQDQDQFLQLSAGLPANEFLETVRACVREMRTQTAIERRSSDGTVGPIPRKWRTIIDEYLNNTNAATVLMRNNAETALDGWNSAVEWFLSMDEPTVAERVARRNRAKNLEARKNESRILELKEKQQNE